jgi:hypothetical protein
LLGLRSHADAAAVAQLPTLADRILAAAEIEAPLHRCGFAGIGAVTECIGSRLIRVTIVRKAAAEATSERRPPCNPGGPRRSIGP